MASIYRALKERASVVASEKKMFSLRFLVSLRPQ
jgi:hypothetical protein